MKLQELKEELQKYQYLEDTDIIDVALASIIATRLKLGDPVWLIIIGPSSGGKSQILRPLALTDPKFMHRIDDVTENTFLSGAKATGGQQISLLNRIGPHGMMVISDLTVIFSKSSESRSTILSQFRMIYDGEMIKYVGTSDKPISWKGYLGIIAGSTPSIYGHFEEVADMGERFIYYRMKDYDAEKATKLSMERKKNGRELDENFSQLYMEYLKEVVADAEGKTIELSETVKNRIIKISMLSEKIRTPVHVDWQRVMDKLPVSAMPMRVALQLSSIAKGLMVLRGEELTEKDIGIIEWCGYSLGNEEKRMCLKTLAEAPYGVGMTTSTIADRIGLSTEVTRIIMQNLSATGVIRRSGSGDGLTWYIKNQDDMLIIRRIEGVKELQRILNRVVSKEEIEEIEDMANQAFSDFPTK